MKIKKYNDWTEPTVGNLPRNFELCKDRNANCCKLLTLNSVAYGFPFFTLKFAVRMAVIS